MIQHSKGETILCVNGAYMHSIPQRGLQLKAYWLHDLLPDISSNTKGVTKGRHSSTELLFGGSEQAGEVAVHHNEAQ
jgi:hypothetical protein